jgi:hypothetical protein
VALSAIARPLPRTGRKCYGADIKGDVLMLKTALTFAAVTAIAAPAAAQTSNTRPSSGRNMQT